MSNKLVDWDHIYLLWYYGPNKKPYLSTWGGDGVPIAVLITNLPKGAFVPLWDAKVPTGAKIQEIPEGVDEYEYAEQHSGIAAFGWYIENGFERR